MILCSDAGYSICNVMYLFLLMPPYAILKINASVKGLVSKTVGKKTVDCK